MRQDLRDRLQALIDSSESITDLDTDREGTFLPVPIEEFLVVIHAAKTAVSN